jgi:tight adherence protein B
LSTRISQAGLDWSKERFLVTSGILGVVAFIVGFLADAGLLVSLVIGFVAAFGLPLWLLIYLKKRRENSFLNAFPDAVDVIVRGIKTGLPLGDCLKVIAAEAQEPVKSEFRTIMETQTVGLPLGDACAKLYERIPLPEANFFGIVITIQQKAGGNLSEALGNLSRVLRDRKKMKAKIQAVSMEAKASASIIAALPIAVMTLVWLTSPEYIELLFVSQIGHMLLAGSAIWMLMGVLVMRKMINFDF